MKKIINIYNADEKDFTHNGLVVLNNCIKCVVEEELNGYYGLELECPTFDKKSNYLIKDNIIKANTPNGYQLFRIYKTIKTMSSLICYARHCFYDLLDNFIESYRTGSVTGDTALKGILNNTQYPTNFKCSSDIKTKADAFYVRRNPVQALIGDDGNSFINRWGGEILRDNFNISILNNIGTDKGVTISYGKNLLGLEEDLDNGEVVTRIMPTGLDDKDCIITIPEKYIDSPNLDNYPFPKIKHLHFSDIKVDQENSITELQVKKQLREKVQELYQIKHIDVPKTNYKVDFVELSKTKEYEKYKVLETVSLGDIVTVKHKKMGIDIRQKVIKCNWDSINQKYIEIELGQLKDNLAKDTRKINNNIKKNEEDIRDTKEDLDNTKDDLDSTKEDLDNTKQDLKDTKKDLDNTKEKTKSEFIKTNDRITFNVEEIGKTNAKLEITADRITTEVNNKINDTNSKVTQTADKIMMEVNDNKKQLTSKIEQTADKITTEVQNTKEQTNSKITQTANDIKMEVNNTKDQLNAKLEITADRITSEVQNNKEQLNSKIEQTSNSIKIEVNDKINNTNTKIEQMSDRITSEVQNNKERLNSKIEQQADRIRMVVDGGGDIKAAEIAMAISRDYSAISMIADRIEIKPRSGVIEFPNGQDIDCRGGDIRVRNSSRNYFRISGDFDFIYGGSILASITSSGIYFRGKRVKLEGEA